MRQVVITKQQEIQIQDMGMPIVSLCELKILHYEAMVKDIPTVGLKQKQMLLNKRLKPVPYH